MATTRDPDADGPTGRIQRTFDTVSDVVDETETGALVTVTVACLALVGAFVGFLLISPYTPAFLVVFLTATAYGWLRHQEVTAKVVTLVMTVVTILILGLITVFILLEAREVARFTSGEVFGITIPALEAFTTTEWRPSRRPRTFSMVPMIHGTVMVTIISTLVAGPLGVAAALFISEIAPPRVREFVKPGVEILAGIPSIVYGFLGLAVLSPWVSDQFNLSGQGTYLFVGIVVGLMALPTVVSVAEDAINSVPESMKSGSLAMGTTDWQTMTSITIPAAFSGISAAVLLGVGRAIGETMAATVMLRNAPRLTEPLYNVFYGYGTLTSAIASNYGSSFNEARSALFLAGVVLFITVLAISIGSQLIESHMHRKLEGMD